MLERQPFGDKSQRYYLTRQEEYTEGLKAAVGIWCAPSGGPWAPSCAPARRACLGRVPANFPSFCPPPAANAGPPVRSRLRLRAGT